MAFDFDRIFYATNVNDGVDGPDIYAFDSTSIPKRILDNWIQGDSDEETNAFLSQLMAYIPENCPFSLLVFSAGLHQSYNDLIEMEYESHVNDKFKLYKRQLSPILPVRLFKLFKLVPENKKNQLKRVYIIHETWLTKNIFDIWKTDIEFVHIENLSQLAQYDLDISKIVISLPNYIIDRHITESSRINVLNKLESIGFSAPLIADENDSLRYFSKIYNNMIAFLTNPELSITFTNKDWAQIVNPEGLLPKTFVNIEVLYHAIRRNQCLDLRDWSFVEHYLILSNFIIQLSNKSHPLIPVDVLLEYTSIHTIDELNSVLHRVLIYRHESPISGTQYNNKYLLIKVLNLLHYLTLKLEQDLNHVNTSICRKTRLKLFLSFTKVFYNEKGCETENDFDQAFDNMFKFISNLLQNWDHILININGKLKVPFVQITKLIDIQEMKEFNMYMNQQPAAPEESSPILNKSGTKLSNPKLRKASPSVSPLPHRNEQESIDDFKLPSQNSWSDSEKASLPMCEFPEPSKKNTSSSRFPHYSTEKLDDFELQPLTLRPEAKVAERNENFTTIKPSQLKYPAKIRQTDKDTEVLRQMELENNSKFLAIASGKKLRGERVSKLTGIYEKKYLEFMGYQNNEV
ncbi:BA75_04443T0 [Komagataella pastoris]|uniref:BA75_04443T0 n=1 Tax=Komagataella pastoris TaxID=4922 RepID=A0A1B2JJ88_PICPA|nr:BA75_04443T0 [Komagataella pastoris]